MESSETIKVVSPPPPAPVTEELDKPSTSAQPPSPVAGDIEEKTKADATAINQMEIQSEPVQFVGLGKEDLLIMANQPFWVRLRWALFITFWLLWLGLLVGAALIIGLSPGCEIDRDEITTTSASSGSHH